VCNLGEKICCIGGWNGQVGIKQCDLFDPDTNDWRKMAPLLTGRYQAGVCSSDNKIYAVGGCDAWNCLSSVEMYDPATDSWNYIKSMITARRGCGLAVFKGKYFAKIGNVLVNLKTNKEVWPIINRNLIF
jgi:influenza virus NS1A-binding protein